MLETKIDKLIEVIEKLIVVLETNPTQKQVETLSEGYIESTQNVPDTNKTTETDLAVTAEELQAICLAKVRANKDNKAKIKKLIEDCGGKLIKDVPENKFAALKVGLEAL